jgi:hypothetical protein
MSFRGEPHRKATGIGRRKKKRNETPLVGVGSSRGGTVMNTRKPWWRVLAYPAVALGLMAGTCDVTRDETPTTTAFQPTPTVTTVAVTTPVEADRVDELTAIAAALNVNRLAAIYNLDLEAVRAVDGTETLFSLDTGIINRGGWDWVAEPSLANIPYRVGDVFLDRPDCAVVSSFIDLRDTLGFEEAEEQIEVIFFDEEGVASLANILPLTATGPVWETICDDEPRTARPLDGG